VKEVQPPDLQAIPDRVPVEAERDELRPRDHTMLPSRHFGERNVGCAELSVIIPLNSAHPVYDRASGRKTGAPRAFRHTLNAQFVTNRA
jgi:hypothetical protein